MIKYVGNQGNLKLCDITGSAIALAKQSGAGHVGKDRYFFWSKEWKVFLALARKAKIEVQR